VRPPPDRSADGPIPIPVEIQAISSQIICETSDGPYSCPPWIPRAAQRPIDSLMAPMKALGMTCPEIYHGRARLSEIAKVTGEA
jgi:hypothetical protein